MRVSAMSMQSAGEPSTGTASPGGGRPIDLVHLSRYTLGNRSLENELLGLFRSQADVYLARLDEAADDKEWKNAAHSLKGSARGLGAWALADLAEEAEHLPADADRGDIKTRLSTAIAAVNVFIDSFTEA
jgi:HPt (histidine-containing phosphotransfer) domain-containing protein